MLFFGKKYLLYIDQGWKQTGIAEIVKTIRKREYGDDLFADTVCGYVVLDGSTHEFIPLERCIKVSKKWSEVIGIMHTLNTLFRRSEEKHICKCGGNCHGKSNS